VIDLIAIRQGDELFIEVKSTAEPTFRLSRSVQGTQQLRDHISYAMLIGATPYYCVKFRKSGKWVISNAEMVSSIVREQDGKSLEEWKP
jgi:Holliday junction resolvase